MQDDEVCLFLLGPEVGFLIPSGDGMGFWRGKNMKKPRGASGDKFKLLNLSNSYSFA